MLESVLESCQRENPGLEETMRNQVVSGIDSWSMKIGERPENKLKMHLLTVTVKATGQSSLTKQEISPILEYLALTLETMLNKSGFGEEVVEWKWLA